MNGLIPMVIWLVFSTHCCGAPCSSPQLAQRSDWSSCTVFGGSAEILGEENEPRESFSGASPGFIRIATLMLSPYDAASSVTGDGSPRPAGFRGEGLRAFTPPLRI